MQPDGDSTNTALQLEHDLRCHLYDAEDGALSPSYSWTVGGYVGSASMYTVSSSDSIGDTLVCAALLPIVMAISWIQHL